MPDMFVTLAAISPNASKVSGTQNIPGVSPSVKDGIWNERALAYTKRPSTLEGLVSYWKLDGNSTDSIGPNNGTDIAISYSVPNGKISSGAGFNGSTSFIDLGSTSSLNLIEMTCSAWVKVTSFTAYYMILTRGVIPSSTYEFRLDATTGKLSFVVFGGSVVSAGALSLGVFHHLCFTRTAANAVVVYIDGVAQGSATLPAATSLPSTPTFLGKRADGFFLNGAIDEVGVWNRALSPTEIVSLYNLGVGIQYPF